MPTTVAAVRAQPDKYEKDFDAVVASLTHYIDKKAPTPSVKVASVTHTKPAKRQKTSTSCSTFRGEIELKKYSREEYDSISAAKCQQLNELYKRTGLIKGKKTPESSRASESRVAKLEVKSENSCDESLFADEKPTASNSNNPVLDREGNSTRQIHADT